MSSRVKLLYTLAFAMIVIVANYTVQFQINDWLTWGAITFPFSFLLTDIMSEKYSKKEVFEVIRNAIIIAVLPTIYFSELSIAAASLTSFFIAQRLDVIFFLYIKEKFPTLWWLRNNASTMLSQAFDTTIFYFLAFSFVMPVETIIKLIIGDYILKVCFALLDTPLFYLFAIKLNNASRRVGI